jgi:hypothetical protein
MDTCLVNLIMLLIKTQQEIKLYLHSKREKVLELEIMQINKANLLIHLWSKNICKNPYFIKGENLILEYGYYFLIKWKFMYLNKDIWELLLINILLGNPILVI